MAGVKGKSGGPRKNAGGARTGAGRPPKKSANDPLMLKAEEDPMQFLRVVMNNPMVEPKIRVDAAKAMLPFVHAKKGDGGKKEAKGEAAKKAANKFTATPAPPRLVVNNGKR